MIKMNRRTFTGQATLGTLLMTNAPLISAFSGNTQTLDAKSASEDGSVLLTNVRIAGQQRGVDVLIANGVITKIGKELNHDHAQVYDCKEALLLPSFIDPHVHLDKTRIGDASRLHHVKTATVAERAANERLLRRQLNHDPFVFGSNLVRQLALKGTTHIRSHIDIDSDIKLKHVEAILRVREKYQGFMDIELVAFPQSGIIKDPGVAKLMEEAINMGVDIVGGLDPQVFDNDLAGHLDTVFNIAEKTGAKLDLHLHEPGEVGLKTFEAIVDRAKALDMKNRINLSHAFALGQISTEQLDKILEKFVDLGISVATSAPGAVSFPPVEQLFNAGVLYAGMSDNIQDMWSPWGDGDQLERAMFIAYRHNFRADDPIMLCYEMVTKNAGQLLGVQNHGEIEVGAAANLTAVIAQDIESAVLHRPERLFTMKNGRFIVQNAQIYMP